MIKILIPLFQYSRLEFIIYAMLVLLGLWVAMYLGMWCWIHLWNRKWVGAHKFTLHSILLTACALPASLLWLNVQTADSLLRDPNRLCENIPDLNSWTLRHELNALPSHLPKEQQADRLFSLLCTQTKCPFTGVATHFTPRAELKNTLESLYLNRSYDREMERLFSACYEQLNRAIKQALAEDQYTSNEALLQEWATLPNNRLAQTLVFLWLLLWGCILTWWAYTDIRIIPPIVSR